MPSADNPEKQRNIGEFHSYQAEVRLKFTASVVHPNELNKVNYTPTKMFLLYSIRLLLNNGRSAINNAERTQIVIM